MALHREGRACGQREQPESEIDRLRWVDPQLKALAQQQSQVVRRSQLAAIGVSKSAVRAHIEGGRWRSVGSLVVVLHRGPLIRKQREWASLLAAGDRAALAGRTALALAGLKGWEDEQVHVLVPRGHRQTRLVEAHTRMHETRWPADGEMGAFGRPLRTPTARSAIDAAIWSTRVRTACGLLAAVVQQQLTTPERLIRELSKAGPVRYRHQLELALADISGGAQALSEIDFHRLCRKHKLGVVIGQSVRLDASGRRRYLDCEIESPNGGRVKIEVDGALHLVVEAYWRDMSRNNELVIAGQAQLRYPTIAWRIDEGGVIDQLRRALAAEDLRLAGRRHGLRAS